MRLQVNESSLDQLVRMSIGIVMLNVAGVATGSLFFIALAIGLIAFVTGLTGFCPTYVLLGISTLPSESKDQRQGGG